MRWKIRSIHPPCGGPVERNNNVSHKKKKERERESIRFTKVLNVFFFSPTDKKVIRITIGYTFCTKKKGNLEAVNQQFPVASLLCFLFIYFYFETKRYDSHISPTDA